MIGRNLIRDPHQFGLDLCLLASKPHERAGIRARIVTIMAFEVSMRHEARRIRH